VGLKDEGDTGDNGKKPRCNLLRLKQKVFKPSWISEVLSPSSL
jgi:hypothetical protein